jgi:molecular chaperone DnaK
MSRTTIDFGIDLGTTNSAIAVLRDVSTEILKNNDDQDVTSSAVGYGRNGQLFIGTRAKNKMIDKPKDAYVEFKRRMGTEFIYAFKESGLYKTPEDLSAEILKSLKADVERQTGERIHAAVITVPAAFELHQCDATRKAAELAGLKGSPLLQEPVAAALAYGFQVDQERAYWLVYDFGGGTFDAALIRADKGLINVVHHGGDNFLGGSDIDWAILERLVAPKLEARYQLPGFKRGNARWESVLLKLKRSIEMAKIELTTRESTTLQECLFEDEAGNEIDGEEITLSRADVVSIATPLIQRSVEICLKVLAEKNLDPASVQKVILVGGPTKAPYFREILRAELGIPIDHSVDPLTVVAKGAAIFAATQKVDPKFQKPAAAGEFQMDLKYKPVGHDTDPIVGGRVSSPSGEATTGFTLEVVNTRSKWRSGRIALGQDGTFMVNLLAEKGARNIFSIELYDATGTRQKAVPDEMVYTVGAVVEEQPLINSMGIARADNSVAWFFQKGDGLPLKKRMDRCFITTKALKPGEAGAAIVIPIVEGEQESADRNRMIGSLKIDSSMIRRDLPVGSEIEVTLKMSTSRILTVNAYVPVLDEEFEQNEDRRDLRKAALSPAGMRADFDKERYRLRTLNSKADMLDLDPAVTALKSLQTSDLARELTEALAAADGDPDAAEKAEKRLLEFKLKLDAIESSVNWPTRVQELLRYLDLIESNIPQHTTEEENARFIKLSAESNDIIEKCQYDLILQKIEHAGLLRYQIMSRRPSYWVMQFQYAEQRIGEISDREKAESLFEMGRRYLTQDNTDGLANVVRQLWLLMPHKLHDQSHRGVGSDIH